ncbi:MAG: hypothetical protein IPN48_05730 [Sphingomonadales bacterium]|nr:hypothetical protein [Sphingomonadales bacterium]
MRRMFLMSASLGLSACATVPATGCGAAEAHYRTGSATAAPRPAPRDWRDRAFSAGGWTLAQGPMAWLPGLGALEPSFGFLHCMRWPDKTIRFGRAGSLPELITSKMTLSSTEISRVTMRPTARACRPISDRKRRPAIHSSML